MNFLLFFSVIINEHEEAIKFLMMIFVLIYTDKQSLQRASAYGVRTVWEQE